MQTLEQGIAQYLEMRRAVGYELREQEKRRYAFAAFLRERGATHITTKLSLEFARLRERTQKPAEWARRLSAIRGFATYWRIFDERTEVPAPRLMPFRDKRAVAHIFTDEEIQKLIGAAAYAARKLLLGVHTYSAIFGLLEEYLDKQGLIEEVINKYLKHTNVGVPFLEEEKARLRGKIRDLAKVVESFSETLRQAALAGQNVAELAQSLLSERKKAEDEQIVLREHLEILEGKTEQFKRNLQGISLRKFLARVLVRFDKLPDTQKKQVIHSVVPKAFVRNDGILELYIDLDPGNPRKEEPAESSPTLALPLAVGADSVSGPR